jgi:hypothetical protein
MLIWRCVCCGRVNLIECRRVPNTRLQWTRTMSTMLVITGEVELPPHHAAFPDIYDMVTAITEAQRDARGRVMQFCCDWPIDGVVYMHTITRPGRGSTFHARG